MNQPHANDRIAFSPSHKNEAHTFLCINDTRKEEIEKHVLRILNTQPELSYADAMLALRDTMRLSTQEWIWVSAMIQKVITEHETQAFLASKGISIRFVTAK